MRAPSAHPTAHTAPHLLRLEPQGVTRFEDDTRLPLGLAVNSARCASRAGRLVPLPWILVVIVPSCPSRPHVPAATRPKHSRRWAGRRWGCRAGGHWPGGTRPALRLPTVPPPPTFIPLIRPSLPQVAADPRFLHLHPLPPPAATGKLTPPPLRSHPSCPGGGGPPLPLRLHAAGQGERPGGAGRLGLGQSSLLGRELACLPAARWRRWRRQLQTELRCVTDPLTWLPGGLLTCRTRAGWWARAKS